MTQTLPVLYSFRRCPYAIRARLALAHAGLACELREINLRNKPQALLDASPKGTVPVLVLEDGRELKADLVIAADDARFTLAYSRIGTSTDALERATTGSLQIASIASRARIARTPAAKSSRRIISRICATATSDWRPAPPRRASAGGATRTITAGPDARFRRDAEDPPSSSC